MGVKTAVEPVVGSSFDLESSFWDEETDEGSVLDDVVDLDFFIAVWFLDLL